MAVLKKKKAIPLFSEQDVCAMAHEYADLSKQIKELTARKNELSEKIKAGAENFGVKDDKGSYYFEDDKVTFGKVIKKSFSINQDKAVKTLNSMGLGDVVDVETTYTVNEDRLNEAVNSGKISLNDVESFTDVRVSYSVSVKEKDAIPEIQQSQFAAKRK